MSTSRRHHVAYGAAVCGVGAWRRCMAAGLVAGFALLVACGTRPSPLSATDGGGLDAGDALVDGTTADAGDGDRDAVQADIDGFDSADGSSGDTDAGTCSIPDPCGGCSDGDFVPEGTLGAACGPCAASRLTCADGLTVCDMSACVCTTDADCSGGEACTAGVCAPVGWAYVAPGEYAKGCTDAFACPEPVVRRTIRFDVIVSRGLLVRITEESEEAWQQVMGGRVVHPDAPSGLPAVFASFDEVATYLNARSDEADLQPCYALIDDESEYKHEWPQLHACTGWRLPTEAEWEYFTRAGTDTRTWLGNPSIADEFSPSRDPLVDRIAYYFPDVAALTNTAEFDSCANGYGDDPQTIALLLADFPDCRPIPVAEREANPWGLHDVLGNVMELVWDRYGDNREYVSAVDPIRPGDTFTVNWSAQPTRSSLGGFYGDRAASMQYLNAYPFRNDRPNLHVGFRAVRSLPSVRLGRTVEPR